MRNKIRYRSAVLLIGAAMAMVTNPVWHAAVHLVSDHPVETTGQLTDIRWMEQDLCPYCDGVSQYFEGPAETSSILKWVQLDEIIPSEGIYDTFAHRYAFRLRAPPVLV